MKKTNFLYIAITIIIVYVSCQILVNTLGEKSVITVIALCLQSGITVLGAVTILYQIKRGHEINELDFFIKLKDSFHNDTQHMELLRKLQNFYENGGEEIAANNIEITRYLAFFDSVYIAYKNNIISIKMIDETFSFYFFLAVHNKKVQDLELIKYATSYKNIFLLYNSWIIYREKAGKGDMYNSEDNENTLIKRYKEYYALIDG